MDKFTLRQDSGSGSMNLQAAGDINVAGITEARVREIALDVAKTELDKLSGEAAATAIKRSDELVDTLLKIVGNQTEQLRVVATDPDFQWTLAQAKLSYARTGDANQRDMLTGLLVKRMEEPQRSLRQIAINESIAVIDKLTQREIAALGLIFTIRHTMSPRTVTEQGFIQLLNKRIASFFSDLPQHDASYQHLEYAACGTVGIGSLRLGDVLANTYIGSFIKPIPVAEAQNLRAMINDETVFNALFHALDTGNSEFAPNCFNSRQQEDLLEKLKLPKSTSDRVISIIERHLLQGDEANEKLIKLAPSMRPLIEHWEEGLCKHFSLSSVGIAIGHAEVRRRTGDNANLSIWIP